MINWPLICALLVPPIGGLTFAMIAKMPEGKAFYESLNKPYWTPPSSLFVPAWFCLNLSVGYASYIVYRDGGSDAKIPLALYIVHLFFNWTWKVVIFRFRCVGLALIHILAVDILATVTAASFAYVNPDTAYYMVPYLCWLGFATVLHFSTWWLNRSGGAAGDKKDDDYTKHEKFRYIT